MDTKKIIQTLAYLAWKQDGHVLDNMKAYKLMWLADRYHVRHNTRTVTGDDYWALPYGPVPSDAKNLIDGRRTAKKSPVGMMDEYLEVLPEHKFRARKEPNVMVFSQSDREALDLVLEKFGGMSPVELSELSHTFPEWKQYEPLLKDETLRNGYMIDKDLFFVNKEEPSGLFVDNPEMLTFAKQMFHEMQESQVMDLPVGLIAGAAREGNIYFFEDDCPVGVKGHMHVCLKVGERVLLFSTCTSQTNTVLNYVKFLGFDANTFPCFKQDEVNKFRKELTYVNCNNVTNLSKDEFAALVKEGKIRSLDGELTEDQIVQVANGVKLSTRVTDEIKALLD